MWGSVTSLARAKPELQGADDPQHNPCWHRRHLHPSQLSSALHLWASHPIHTAAQIPSTDLQLKAQPVMTLTNPHQEVTNPRENPSTAELGWIQVGWGGKREQLLAVSEWEGEQKPGGTCGVATGAEAQQHLRGAGGSADTQKIRAPRKSEQREGLEAVCLNRAAGAAQAGDHLSQLSSLLLRRESSSTCQQSAGSCARPALRADNGDIVPMPLD